MLLEKPNSIRFTVSEPATSIRTRRHLETRREILDSAWALAERDGLNGLSLRDLAEAVGMRAPSLYTYFDSKGAIYDAMFAEGYRSLDASLDGLDADDGEPVAALGRVIVRFLEFCTASVPRYQLMFTRAVPDWEPSAESYAVSVASYERMVEHLARHGVEGQHTVDLWTALVAGLAAQQLANDPGGDRWMRLSEDAARMVLDHVRRHQ